MSTLLSDLRSALRQLRHRPGATLVAVLALAVGIGGATAIFSVADATLLRPLPFPRAHELVRVWETTPDGKDFSSAEPTFLDFRARTRAFAGFAAMRVAHPTLTGLGEPQRLDAAAASASLFPLLGARAALGRTFAAAEERPDGAARVAVVSDAFWRRQLGADPAAVGRALTLDGATYTVVGVLGPDFAFAPAVAVWLPLAPNAGAERDNRDLDVVGRVRPGVTLAQARADLARVAGALAAEHPHANAGWGVRVASFSDWLLGPTYRRAVWVLLGAVGCLLLLACANVANLLVAQAAAREGELGLRAALGASRARVARHLAAESAVLAALGGAGGAALAAWAVRAAGALRLADGPRLDGLALDGRVLAFALGTTALTALLCGALPALRAARLDLSGMLAAGTRAGSSVRAGRVRDALVVAQVALTVVLLVGAGLLLASFRRLASTDTGIAAERVLAAPVPLPESRYSAERQRAFARDVVARAAALPGVQSAAVTVTNPFREYGYANDVTPAERAATAPPSGLLTAGWRSVTPDFFRTLGVPLLRGRAFGAGDRDGAERVVVISASLARELWPGADAVGRALYWGGLDGSPKRVVGVVGDVRDRQLDAAPQPMVYLPFDQVEMPTTTLLLRVGAGGSAAALAPAVRAAVWSVDPRLAVPEVTPLARNRDALVAGPRFRALLLAGFAGVALLLAALGVYGVMAHAVAQRTREIGVRVALGARPAAVAGAVVRRGLALAAAGLALGLAASVAGGRAAAGLLYETSPSDAATLAGVVVVVAATALAAAWLPSRRAARVDPVRALRGAG